MVMNLDIRGIEMNKKFQSWGKGEIRSWKQLLKHFPAKLSQEHMPNGQS